MMCFSSQGLVKFRGGHIDEDIHVKLTVLVPLIPKDDTAARLGLLSGGHGLALSSNSTPLPSHLMWRDGSRICRDAGATPC
jgi:hypothetical protein